MVWAIQRPQRRSWLARSEPPCTHGQVRGCRRRLARLTRHNGVNIAAAVQAGQQRRGLGIATCAHWLPHHKKRRPHGSFNCQHACCDSSRPCLYTSILMPWSRRSLYTGSMEDSRSRLQDKGQKGGRWRLQAVAVPCYLSLLHAQGIRPRSRACLVVL